MSFTARLNAVGGYSVTLKPGTPYQHRVYSKWDWIVITHTDGLPEEIDRAGLLEFAAFTGPIRSRRRKGTTSTYSGPGLLALLGDEQGKGPATTTISEIAGNWQTFWATGAGNVFGTATRVNGLTVGGTADSIGITQIGLTDGIVTRQGIAEELGEENLTYPLDIYVSPQGFVYYGYPNNLTLFRTLPKLCLWPYGTVVEQAEYLTDPKFAVRSELEWADDDDDYATDAAVTYDGGVARAGADTALYGFDGSSQLYMEVTAEDTTITTATPAGYKADALKAEHATHYELTARCEALPELRSQAAVGDRAFLEPGDYVFLYDPDIGMSGGSLEWNAGGITCRPVYYRCIGLTMPIIEGMGVYRASNDWDTITDLTPWVEFESGDMELEIGEAGKPRTLKSLVGN